ncbi:hypothetical protein BJ875DRAFT_469153 [Amylocarpus encephaloides]|uniref:DUF7053 domain-containing protein n=1 Tax=Amylocarpus encephaloides TaxID=45428 RepID=A0A9P8C2M4_9HELO|nr:hypothetical protein BJ875DRAFT_469153 [Amylocarpus encephaloides]
MGFFTTTATVTHTIPLPANTPRVTVIELLRDHDFLIRIDPEMESYSQTPSASSESDSLVKSYVIINDMPAIPKSLYDAKVKCDVVLTDVEDGTEGLVHAPLGVVQKGIWKVAGSEGNLELVIMTEIACSRLAMGIVKAKAEANGPVVKKGFLEALEKLEREGEEKESVKAG